MHNISGKFFELIQISLGNKCCFKQIPTDEEWYYLYDLAIKQSLVGILLEGLRKINLSPSDLDQRLKLEWIGVQQTVYARNVIQRQRIQQLFELLSNGGFNCCLLKGQGTALYYDTPELRQCGDIDVWVKKDEYRDNNSTTWDANITRDTFLDFARKKKLHIGHVDIKHSDVDFFKDEKVEIHFLPSWLYNPWNNKRLQHFFLQQSKKQFEKDDKACGFTHTTLEFDLVFSIVHIYRHLFSEGIGLRQLMDYYFILKASNREQRISAFNVLRGIDMSSFVGGVMWVLVKQFGMTEEYALCNLNENHGKFLINEFLIGGNFGRYDKRRVERGDKGKFRYGLIQFKKNLRFVKYYPSEVLWSPLWKTWHYVWRKKKQYI